MTLNYDKNTFGNSPAAMYLTLKLNEQGDPILARKVGKVLRETRELLHDIVACHVLTNEMKRASFCKLLNMVRDRAKSSANKLPDTFIGHLVLNILTGEIRTYEHHAVMAAQQQKKVVRSLAEGLTVPDVKALRPDGSETNEERVARLQEKSRQYLARKNKVNTLY